MPNLSVSSSPGLPRAVLHTQWAAVVCTLLLILLGAAWELWLAPTGSGTLVLKTLPLVVALPGLARRRLYTYRWTSLLVWLYFAEGVVRATAPAGGGAALAALQTALSLALFAACVGHVRLRLRSAPSHG